MGTLWQRINNVWQQEYRFDEWVSCADPESFVRGGPILITFFLFVFLVDGGIEDPNTALIGPSSARR